MTRFQLTKRSSLGKTFLISIAFFVVVTVMLVYGINSISTKTRAEEKRNLENALQRGITQCYAVEGTYPESLDYLKEHYGITYDEDVFFVDYKASGANILPDVTIIEKGE